MTTFPALLLHRDDDGVEANLTELDQDRLPPGDVLVEIAWSSLNYKDSMVVKGLGRLVREYPHVPGIDLAGTVLSSRDARFAPGDEVLVTGFRVGELHWGGYARQARLQGDWLVPLPAGLTGRQAMGIGTAGLAAMLGVMALEHQGLAPGQGEVLVTGATGGVGSIAVALLAALDYEVVAVTGKQQAHDYLRELGATTILDRTELAEAPERPLLSERWAGCIDNVGGDGLARVLAALRQRGSVAAIGLADSNRFPGDLIPFLLRGVNLLGIDTNATPMAERLVAWPRLVRDLPLHLLDSMITVHPLSEVPALAEAMLAGQVRGRTVIELPQG